MRIYEITNPEDQLALLKMIMDNTWAAISRQPRAKAPIAKAAPAAPLKRAINTKAITKPKKAPYAAAPKPLPKPKSLPQTPTQIKIFDIFGQKVKVSIIPVGLNDFKMEIEGLSKGIYFLNLHNNVVNETRKFVVD